VGRLTTHVLDTTHGRAAAGMGISLYSWTPESARLLLGAFTTNADGRCDGPLLVDATFALGTYELDFAVGDYFAGLGVALPSPRFLDVVTLRFGIADGAGQYHVPLLCSPWSYSTYRGS
jgi:5-hydroxyisourate hydrolase